MQVLEEDDPYASPNQTKEVMEKQENNLEDVNEWTLDSANSSYKIRTTMSFDLQLLPRPCTRSGFQYTFCSVHLLLV